MDGQQTFTFDDAEAGSRLDVLLAARLVVSRSRAHRLLGSAHLNGRPARPSHSVKAGDVLTLAPEPALPTAANTQTDGEMPPIVFEDDHLLVINKPRGLTVHPGAGEPAATLVDILRASGRPLSTVGPPERAGIVHRLDKDTSGLMMVCKTDQAHWRMAAQFEAHTVDKRYDALVCGVPPRRGRIEAPIARHPVQRTKMAVAPAGRPSVTEYNVVRSWPKFALLNVNLLTGRTHQIRVHLAYVQHPVACDGVYGGRKRALQAAPDAALRDALEALPGQALHAGQLRCQHPVTEEPLSFHIAMPDDMQRIVAALDVEPQ